MKVRTRLERVRPVVVFDPSEKKVDSSGKAEADINTIVARARKTGQLGDEARKAAARYGDFSGVPSFVEMQERILAAQELFAALPATVRRTFENDPAEFLAASQTEEGRELMKKLGLGKEAGVEPEPPRQPAPSPDAPPSPPAASKKQVSASAKAAPESAKDGEA